MSFRIVLVALLLSIISMQGIQARGLGLKEGKALKKEDNILATIEKLVASVATLMNQEYEDGVSSAGKGSIIITSSDQKVHGQAIKWKAMRRQARSVKQGTEAEGAFDSSENDVVEDVVVMDYALPHRKPPIHNEKS